MSEKKMWELQIDAEFRDLIPPLQEEELELLEASILVDGCVSPLTTWRGTLVDGHNRYAICHKHSIPFAIMEKEFADRDAVMQWMLTNQLGRRNLNDYQRGEMVLKLRPMLSAAAHRRKQHKDLESPSAEPLPPELAEAPKPKAESETMSSLGKMAGISRSTMKKVKKLSEDADEETKNKLRNSEVSVSKAYDDLLTKERAAQTRECVRCRAVKSLNEFPISRHSHVFSDVCKECTQKEQEATRDDNAALVSTGMELHVGVPVHVATTPTDSPDMFVHVVSLIDFASRTYLDNIRTALKRFTPTMNTAENIDRLEQLITSASDTAKTLLTDTLKEME